eukprot:Hpha_TRINITY_DN16643_c0_g3::TRINITY_DN16643_c0_g3_i2::g.181889::m.181889
MVSAAAHMQAARVQPNSITYTTYLRGCSFAAERSGDSWVRLAEDAYRRAVGARVGGRLLLHKMGGLYAKLADTDALERVRREALQRGVRPSARFEEHHSAANEGQRADLGTPSVAGSAPWQRTDTRGSTSPLP